MFFSFLELVPSMVATWNIAKPGLKSSFAVVTKKKNFHDTVFGSFLSFDIWDRKRNLPQKTFFLVAFSIFLFFQKEQTVFFCFSFFPSNILHFFQKLGRFIWSSRRSKSNCWFKLLLDLEQLKKSQSHLRLKQNYMAELFGCTNGSYLSNVIFLAVFTWLNWKLK